jgi:hypothetical protein
VPASCSLNLCTLDVDTSIQAMKDGLSAMAGASGASAKEDEAKVAEAEWYKHQSQDLERRSRENAQMKLIELVEKFRDASPPVKKIIALMIDELAKRLDLGSAVTLGCVI